ncbi:alpha/beta hydrolase [Pseudanabaenaceae cyanobacterium LEGE 13415]|nr:alpha/beta hydrolase [Pseudanabaenaceae cyanobacterium LEGE 13415]
MSFLRNSVLGVGMALLISTPAMAAERVVFKYRILRESVSVPELATFAQTGEASSNLQTYFRLSGQRPETVRTTLTRPIKVDPVLLDRVLNSPIGNTVLDQLGQAIQTPRGGAERQALRAALTLSASGDNTITLVEILQNYPTQEVIVDGDRIEGAYRRLNNFIDRLRNPLQNIFR